jgi:hypothetical protein
MRVVDQCSTVSPRRFVYIYCIVTITPSLVRSSSHRIHTSLQITLLCPSSRDPYPLRLKWHIRSPFLTPLRGLTFLPYRYYTCSKWIDNAPTKKRASSLTDAEEVWFRMGEIAYVELVVEAAEEDEAVAVVVVLVVSKE